MEEDERRGEEEGEERAETSGSEESSDSGTEDSSEDSSSSSKFFRLNFHAIKAFLKCPLLFFTDYLILYSQLTQFYLDLSSV